MLVYNIYILSLTIFVHSHLHAFFQTASLALISMRFVDNTSSGASLTSAQEKFIIYLF